MSISKPIHNAEPFLIFDRFQAFTQNFGLNPRQGDLYACAVALLLCCPEFISTTVADRNAGSYNGISGRFGTLRAGSERPIHSVQRYSAPKCCSISSTLALCRIGNRVQESVVNGLGYFHGLGPSPQPEKIAVLPQVQTHRRESVAEGWVPLSVPRRLP